jgi:hypothetical protein
MHETIARVLHLRGLVERPTHEVIMTNEETGETIVRSIVAESGGQITTPCVPSNWKKVSVSVRLLPRIAEGLATRWPSRRDWCRRV